MQILEPLISPKTYDRVFSKNGQLDNFPMDTFFFQKTVLVCDMSIDNSDTHLVN